MRSIEDPAKFIEHLQILMSERDLLDLLARFDDAAIRTDLDRFRDLWTEDSTWEIGPPVPMQAKGRDAIVQALKTLQTQNLFFFRLTARPVIQLDGDRAELRSPTVELAGRAGHLGYANVAFYVDEVVRDAGVWRFRKRSYQYIWVDTQSQLQGQTVPLHAAIAEVNQAGDHG